MLSDDDGASDRIDAFSAGDSRWLVAVRMVSEGVDVPRLAVGVYATSTATPLFFAQAVGRFVRARRRGETASVFLPSVPQLLALANTLELERDHALDRPKTLEEQGIDVGLEDGLLDEANRERNGADEIGPDGKQGAFEALEAQASFDRVLFDGGEFGTGAEMGSDEELDFLGLPGLLDADQVSALLRQRQADQLSGRKRSARGRRALAQMDHRKQAELRKELVAAGGGVGAQERSAARVGAQRAAAPVRRARRSPWRIRTSSRRGSRWSAGGSSASADAVGAR